MGLGETHSVHFVRRPLIGLLYQHRMTDDDDDECEALDGMRMAGETEVLGENLSQCYCPPQIPHILTWDRSQAATVGSRPLTTWAIARTSIHLHAQRRSGVNEQLKATLPQTSKVTTNGTAEVGLRQKR
jgi:hypothetical protein